MPGPLSSTWIETDFSKTVHESLIRPPSGVNFTALERRLIMIWRSLSASARAYTLAGGDMHRYAMDLARASELTTASRSPIRARSGTSMTSNLTSVASRRVKFDDIDVPLRALIGD